PSPCMAIECRLSKADEVAQLATLYADQILLRDPFPPIDQIGDLSTAKYQLAGAIAVMQRLEPLLRAGVVGIAATRFHYCAQCGPPCKENGAGARRRVNRAVRVLREGPGRQIRLGEDASRGLLFAGGPEELFPHGRMFFPAPKPPRKRNDEIPAAM